MNLITFDALRGFGIPGTTYIKPDSMMARLSEIKQADWLLFPGYWQVNALYYGLHKPVFPSISTYHLGHDKIEMTRVLQLLWPAHVPETLILANTPANRQQVLDSLDFPFVAKTVRASMGQGVWLIRTMAEWEAYTAGHEVLYVQEYLPLDRDLRLVLIGRKVIAGYWRHCPAGGFHANVARGGRLTWADIPEAAVALVETVAARLDIDHAGFDLAAGDGHFYFFEFNRLFGTSGLMQMGIQPGPLIHAYLQSRTQPPLIPPQVPPRDDFRRAS
ncbi:MAG: ATP-grasp domain-containing protein [Desulfosudaceae bacterium]